MSEGRLQRIIREFRQRLAVLEATSQAALVTSYTTTLARVEAQLDALYRQIDALQQTGQKIPVSWLYDSERLEQARAFIESQFNLYGQTAYQQVQQVQQQSVLLGMQAAQEQLAAMLPQYRWQFTPPSADILHRLVGATQAGSPLADLFRGFGVEPAKQAGLALLHGVLAGSSVQTIARDVRQALQVPRWRALTIARTEALRPYRAANIETYKASGLVTRYRRIAAKQARTCAVCLALDGTIYDLETDFAQHPNCRCTLVPILASQPVLAYQNGEAWLQSQSAKVQQQVLGSGAKYALWKSGEITLLDLVKRSDDPDWGPSVSEKSVKQLKRRNA